MNHVKHLREKSALHLGGLGKRRWDAESLGEVQPQAIQQGCLSRLRAHHAPQAQFAAVGGGHDDVGALDAAEFLQDRPWAVAQARPPLPLLQRLPEHVGVSIPSSVCDTRTREVKQLGRHYTPISLAPARKLRGIR